MMSNLAARGTFYDIFGYLVPGFCTEVLLWAVSHAFFDETAAIVVIRKACEGGGCLILLLLICGAYVLGHLINSLSGVVYERWLLLSMFTYAINWQARIKKKGGGRIKEIELRARRLFNIEAKGLQMIDLLVRAAEYLLNAFVSGLCFLSFYGIVTRRSSLCKQ